MEISKEDLAKIFVVFADQTISELMPFLSKSGKEAYEASYNQGLEEINKHGIEDSVNSFITCYNEKTK